MKDFNKNTVNNPVYLTPPDIIESLGVFDLDPCSPEDRPWTTALNHYTKKDDGLLLPWFGRVWCNPPYGRLMGLFMHKLALHGNGIGLTFARTDTKAFHEYVFPFAESIFFFKKRISFYDINGNQCRQSSAPSVLISYGELNAEAIDDSGLIGKHVPMKNNFMIVGISRDATKTWRIIVGEALTVLKKESNLTDIYEAVIDLAPNRVRKNVNYKAKIRQVLQNYYERVERGVYKN